MQGFLDLAWILGAGIGHTCLIALAINVVHGFGWRTRWIEPVTLAVLAVLGVATLGVGAWACWVGPARWGDPLRAYAALGAVVGLVGLPVVSVLRAVRRDPPWARVHARPLDLGEGPPERFVGDGPHRGVLRWPGNESLRPVFHELTIETHGLPAALDGLSVIHLTDLHLAPCYDRSFFEAVLDAAAATRPDLVLLTGDVVEHEEAVAWIAPLLGRVHGRLGSYAIVGNHDFRYGEAAVRRGIAEAGYLDVDGLWTTVHARGATLALGGTSAPWGPDLDRLGMPAADLRIVLSHTPDQFPRIAGWDAVDLLLCGHNHGGQIRMPGIGSILVPSRYSRRYDRGLFRRGRTTMYVGCGLGAKHPIRWNCPPELTRIVLRAAGHAGHASTRHLAARRAGIGVSTS